MAKELNYNRRERKFAQQFRYFVHFRTNTLWKGMNSLYIPRYVRIV